MSSQHLAHLTSDLEVLARVDQEHARAGVRSAEVGVAVGAVALTVLTGSSAVTRTSATFLAVEVAATVALAVVAWGSLRLGRSQRA